MSKNKNVIHPCRSCVYFNVCGDNMREMPCDGRITKSERKAKEKSEAERIRAVKKK